MDAVLSPGHCAATTGGGTSGSRCVSVVRSVVESVNSRASGAAVEDVEMACPVVLGAGDEY